MHHLSSLHFTSLHFILTPFLSSLSCPTCFHFSLSLPLSLSLYLPQTRGFSRQTTAAAAVWCSTSLSSLATATRSRSPRPRRTSCVLSSPPCRGPSQAALQPTEERRRWGEGIVSSNSNASTSASGMRRRRNRARSAAAEAATGEWRKRGIRRGIERERQSSGHEFLREFLERKGEAEGYYWSE